MRTAGIALAAGCAAALACDGNKAPPLTASVKMDSPRAVADGVMLAIKERNPALAGTLLAPEETIRKQLDCPDDGLAKRIAAKRARLAAEFGEPPSDTVVEIAKFDKHGSSDQQLRKGDAVEGCTTKGLAKIHRSKIELRSSKGGAAAFEDQLWLFLQFGDEPSWYWVP
jgi:hypothetical protein